MDPFTMMLIGGGLGGLKGLFDHNKAAKDKVKHDKYRSAVTRYSPWTGMGTPAERQLGSEMGAALGGAAQGAMLASMFGGGGGGIGGSQLFADTGASQFGQLPSAWGSMQTPAATNPYGLDLTFKSAFGK